MVMPMFLAVPSTTRMAASMVVQFKSGNLVSAISCRHHSAASSANIQDVQALLKREQAPYKLRGAKLPMGSGQVG